MSFNWGTGIAMFYAAFMALMVGAVVCSRQQDNALVSDQYYAEDLRYQEHFDKLANAGKLEAGLHIDLSADHRALLLRFPGEMEGIQGEVYFFRPSDKASDFRVTLSLEEGNRQVIPVEGLDPGLWRIKVDWAAAGKAYYTEKALTF